MPVEKKVLELIKKLYTDKYKKGKKWKGFQVYEPIYSKDIFIGEPTVVLEKEGRVRFSTYKESFEYLRYSQGLEK